MELVYYGTTAVLAFLVGGGTGVILRSRSKGGRTTLQASPVQAALEAPAAPLPKGLSQSEAAQLERLRQADRERHAKKYEFRANKLEDMRVDLSTLSNAVPKDDRTAVVGRLMNYLAHNGTPYCRNYEHEQELRVALTKNSDCLAPETCPNEIWEKRESLRRVHHYDGGGYLDFNTNPNLFYSSSSYSHKPVSRGFADQMQMLLNVMAVFPSRHPGLEAADVVIMGMATYLHDILRPSVERIRRNSASGKTTEDLRAKQLKSLISKTTTALREQRDLLTEEDMNSALFQAVPVVERKEVKPVEVAAAVVAPYQELLDGFVQFADMMTMEQKHKHDVWVDQVQIASETLAMASGSSSSKKDEIMKLAQGNYELAEDNLRRLLGTLQEQADEATVYDLRVAKVFLEDGSDVQK